MENFKYRFFAIVVLVYVIVINTHFILLERLSTKASSVNIIKDSFFDSFIWQPEYFIFWIALILALFFVYLYKYMLKKSILDKQQKEIDDLFEQVDDFVLITKTDIYGKITYVSDAFCTLSGYTKDELIGQTHKIMRHPHNNKEFSKNIWKIISTGHIWSGEIKNQKKNGSDFWIRGNIVPSFDDEHEVIGYTSIQVDITSTKDIERLNLSLTNQVEYFDAVIKSANSGIGTMTLDGVFTSVNSVYSKLFGYPEDELIGRSCVDMTIASQQEAAKLYLKFARDNGKIYKVTKTCVHKNKSLIQVEMSLDLLPHRNEFVVVVNSLEGKIKLQKALNRAELLYKNAAVGFLIVDTKGKILEVNQKLCDIFGYKEAELVRKQSKILHLSDRMYEIFLLKIGEQCTKQFVQIEFELKTKNDSAIWCEISGFPFDTKMNLDDGAVIWTIVNVTDKVNFRNLILEQSKELENRVKEEVEKNIQNQKLYLEDKVSSAKFSAIGKLAAGITHEINTPLTYIKGNLEMMNGDIDDITEPELKLQLKEDMTKVFTGIKRVENIVESMREMSQKSSEGKENINIFSTLITALTMAYNRSKHISKIILNGQIFEIGMNKNSEVFNVNVQKQRIEQVWINIINNALDELVKVGSFEERYLKIDLFSLDDSIVVRFHDNAGGVKEDILENIFEPFVSTKVHGGMGVGLNISKRIIEDNNGTINAYNEDDGAVFEIKLKLANEGDV